MNDKLVQGKIPAYTVCFWRSQCPSAQNNTCHHKGINHAVPFSCGFARAFKIFQVTGDSAIKTKE